MGKPLSFFDLPEYTQNASAEDKDDHATRDQFAHRQLGDPGNLADDPIDPIDDFLHDQSDCSSADPGDPGACALEGPGGDLFDLAGALDFAAKLEQAQRQDLSRLAKAVGSGTKGKGQGEFVTSESFEEGIARSAYLVIERYARALLYAGDNLDIKHKAIDFFFVPSSHRMTFFDCCAAIDPSIRPGVILLRMQYEFWRKWFVFNTPLPDGAEPLPEQARGPASFVAGPEGVWVAQEAWYHPSVDTRTLITRSMIVSPVSTQASIERTIEKLHAAGVLSHGEPDHWYATGRNPTLLADGESRKTGGSITWSSMF
jgi:hypothetical protein